MWILGVDSLRNASGETRVGGPAHGEDGKNAMTQRPDFKDGGFQSSKESPARYKMEIIDYAQ